MLKRSYFKTKPHKPLRRTKLRLVGHSTTLELKKAIQGILRALVIARDRGCILRNYPEAGNCGGYRKDGELILQCEHLLTRSNSATFGDPRNVVCLCRNHHVFFKPQHGKLYWELIRKHIGEKLWNWLKRCEEDTTPHKVDWKMELIALKQEFDQLEAPIKK